MHVHFDKLMPMKLLFSIFALQILLILSNTIYAQTNYTTIAAGNWSNASSWDINGVPPSPLPIGDSIFVIHAIDLDQDQPVLGVMTVESMGSLSSANKSLKIGKGGYVGRLYNYGDISIKKLEAKPNPGGGPSILDPAIHNYGTITASGGMSVGRDLTTGGALYNYTGGKIVLGGDLHLDGYFCNADTMTISTPKKLKLHGGIVDCCGTILVDRVEFEAKEGREGTLKCANICSESGIEPTFVIKDPAASYSTFASFLAAEGLSGTSHIIDNDSTTICSLSGLPIELLSFTAEVFNEEEVNVIWETGVEENNDFFEVLRSSNGLTYKLVATVRGAGNSSESRQYNVVDSEPLDGTSYYLLRQTDFDGNTEDFGPKAIEINNNTDNGNCVLTVYPNPCPGNCRVKLSECPHGNPEIRLMLADATGRVVSEMYDVRNFDGSFDIKIDKTNNLKSGIYIITASAGDENFSKKFIAQ